MNNYVITLKGNFLNPDFQVHTTNIISPPIQFDTALDSLIIFCRPDMGIQGDGNDKKMS